MKLLIQTLLVALAVLSASADGYRDAYNNMFKRPCDLENDLPKTFAEIKSFLAKPEPTKAKAIKLREENMMYLRYCIDLTLNASTYTNHMLGANQTARCKDIEKVASLLQPYNQWMLGLEFGDKNSTNESLIYAVCSLLPFTKPDEVFRNTLEKKMLENTNNISVAFRLLYEHDLVTQPVQEIFINFVHNQKDPKEKKRLALGAAIYGFGDDAIPYCEELLSQPFKVDGLIDEHGYAQGNQMTSDYQMACDTLEYIGTNANRLLPLLKKRQAEITSAKGVDAAKPFMLGNFYTAIKCLEGSRPVSHADRSPYCTWCK